MTDDQSPDGLDPYRAPDRMRIDRGELFNPEVDKALAREKAGRERIIADAPPVSALRRLLLNSLFYFPIAAALGAFLTWKVLEPYITELAIVRGEIILINAEPFDHQGGTISLTIGSDEVIVAGGHVKLDPGEHGEPAIEGVEALKVGDHVEVAGLMEGSRVYAAGIRPSREPPTQAGSDKLTWPQVLLFPLTAALIAFGLLAAEGFTTRNWARMVERTLLGSLLAVLFAFLAFMPAGVFMLLSKAAQTPVKGAEMGVYTIREMTAASFLIATACRSAAWACIGAGTGLGMNLVRSTRPQLRNSVVGGALGGALGGVFFDPIDRFFGSMYSDAGTSRLVGLLAVGLSIGVFVALVERLARDAWLRVRTGPLAGKSFILYKTPTIIGNAPQSDVYLYKDAEIDPSHASVHRVGTSYEIEDMSTRMGTSVGGNKIRRRRLVSGDQIVIGSTILDFEERQKRTPAA